MHGLKVSDVVFPVNCAV